MKVKPRGNGRLRRCAVAVILAAFLPLATSGCFGQFQLVKNVYRFNREVTPDPWMQWFVFLVMNIVPIYGLAVSIDALIANSVEFWSGDNPIEPTPQTKRLTGWDGSTITLTRREGETIEVAWSSPTGSAARFSVKREGTALVARKVDGTLLARVVDVDGTPAIVTPSPALAPVPWAAHPAPGAR